MSEHLAAQPVVSGDASYLLERLQTPAFPRTAARWLVVAFAALFVGLAFVPWQQNVGGTGQVVALDPLERPQTIQATIPGIIDEWYVREGTKVKQGDRLVVIRDNDPLLLSRLKDAVVAAQDKLEATQAKITSYKEQVNFYKAARDLQISITQSQLEIAKQKLRGDNQTLAAAQAAKLQAEQKLERYRQLVAEKLASPQELEIETAYAAKAAADYAKATAEVDASSREVKVKEDYIRYAEADANAKIVEADTKLQTAEGEEAAAKSSLLKAQSELAAFEQQVISAPRDGTVVRLLANAGQKGGQVAQGDPLLQFVPDYSARAVELWVDGNDAPWVTPGRRVRLQFEGWPALQFAAGWPSAALGTFGGEVLLVDAAPNAYGRFRVLIVPSSDPAEAEWPGLHVDPAVDVRRELRQGVRCNGWVLLNEVPLGYELWRQLNGFPPSIEPDRYDPYHVPAETKEKSEKPKAKTKDAKLGEDEK